MQGANIRPSGRVDYFFQIYTIACHSAVWNLWATIEPVFGDGIVDREIELAELEYVFKKMKNNKAPEKDRIPFEFYKRAPVELKKIMVLVFNCLIF